MTEATPFLRKYDITFLCPLSDMAAGFFQAEVFAKSAIMASMPCMIS